MTSSHAVVAGARAMGTALAHARAFAGHQITLDTDGARADAALNKLGDLARRAASAHRIGPCEAELEAMRMLQDGLATAEDIGTAMELGYRHPMGPLGLPDVAGPDVRPDIARNLAGPLGPRFQPPALLQLVEEGPPGNSTGSGSHEWSAAS